MLRSLVAAGLLLFAVSSASAQWPFVVREARLVEPVDAVAPAPSDDEVKKLVAENPTLVRELLTVGTEQQEAGLLSIVALGTPAVEPLIAELDNENEEVRAAAANVLCYTCAHEDAPRSKIVRELLKLKAAHPDEGYGELLFLVIRMTRPDVRATYRRQLEHALTDGLVETSSPSACPPGGCPLPPSLPPGAAGNAVEYAPTTPTPLY